MTGIDLTTLLNDGRKKQTLKTEGKVAEKARKRSFKRNWGKGHPLIHTYDFFILIYHFSPSELCIYNSHSLFKILKSKTVNSFIHFLHFLWHTWGIVPSAEKHFRRMLNWEGWIHYKFAQFWCSVCFIDSTLSVPVRSEFCSARLTACLLCLSVSHTALLPLHSGQTGWSHAVDEGQRCGRSVCCRQASTAS